MGITADRHRELVNYIQQKKWFRTWNRVSIRKGRENRGVAIIESMMPKNFPVLMKDTDLRSQTYPTDE